jgi:hypothetical protein
MQESDYFIVFLVQARHLDYTENKSFLRSIAKHPSDGTKNSDVGHAWVYLQGNIDGHPMCLEGGHSGERGISQPKYFEGVIECLERGDPNPIRYLWECQKDGYFEEGSGGHQPTYAAKIDLTPEQFQDILRFIEQYCYEDYYLTNHQCASFLTEIAARVGIVLQDKVTVEINPVVCVSGEYLPLWEDPCYNHITLCSPDKLEESLMQLVYEGRMEYALDWYFANFRETQANRAKRFCDTINYFPDRFCRYKCFW